MTHAVPLHLFTVPKAAETDEWKSVLSSKSLRRLTGCKLEPSLKPAAPGSRYPFERQSHF